MVNEPNNGKRDRTTLENCAPSLNSKRRRTELYENDGQSFKKLAHRDYTVGWVCALPIELAAAEAMFDELHEDLPPIQGDINTYKLGSINQHNVVIAVLPRNGYGTNNAAAVARDMERSFPSLRVRLMVGIGGGAPSQLDIRLGDVVVSDAVVQYDIGKVVQSGKFHPQGTLHRPPPELMTAVASLEATYRTKQGRVSRILDGVLERNLSMAEFTSRRETFPFTFHPCARCC